MPKKNKTEVITIRLTAAEKADIKREAEKHRRSMGAYLMDLHLAHKVKFPIVKEGSNGGI